MTTYPTLPLNDGRQLPQLGFGTFQLEGDKATNAVKSALETGYWLIDTAAFYDNEKEVGAGIGQAGDIFLQTKLWNDRHGYDEARKATQESLDRLGRDQVDMMLIHWPCPSQDKFVETWKAFIEMRDEGLAKSIGVSNFRPDDLKRIVDATGVVPALNQIELHPSFQQRELRAVHQEMGIVTQCWSPLGQGEAMKTDIVGDIAKAHDTGEAAVILAWHLAHGLAPIPKSGTPEHIRSNFAALDVTLGAQDLAALDSLDDAEGRMGPDPATLG